MTTEPRAVDRTARGWSGWDHGRRGLALVVVVAIALAVGAWIASLVIESPREAAANAAAPPPSLITVSVERRKVGQELVTRGLVTATQTVEAIPPDAGRGAERALVSGRIPAPGQQVDAGDVVVEISGRPVVALQGAVPAYRSLSPGDSGPDVRQLHAALADAGLDVDEASGRYDDRTAAAVTALFRRAGYTSGGSLSSAEVLIVSTLPASVVTSTAVLGGEAASSSIQVASGELRVSADFPAVHAALLQPGARVVLSSEILGVSVDATIQPVEAPAAGGPSGHDDDDAGQPGDGVDGAAAATWTVVPDEPLTHDWAGQDVKVRVVSAVTEQKVLAVPVTAIVADGSGGTEVVVVAREATSIADASPQRVAVTVGATGGGWAEVVPRDKAKLSEGDPVQLSAAAGSGHP